MDDYDEYDDDERPDRVRSAVMTALVALALVIALIAIGTTIVVRSLGLSNGDSPGPVGSAPKATPLPTTALPSPSEPGEPGDSTGSPSDLGSPSTPDASGRGPIELSVSPVLAKPMERVNLTGTYPGHDNVGLTVQRWEAGGWQDFGVTATVKVGTFETFVMTGRRGDNRFRMYDPDADNGSNPVVVTIQ